MSALLAPFGSVAPIVSPRTVTEPFSSGGPETGNTQRAVNTCSLAIPAPRNEDKP
jgi:hypothetical protein